jgi:nicotinic acid mononucleotide adenylyltransferase
MKIILVLAGSFNPVHNGHIDALIKAKTYMEDVGYTIGCAYLAPSSDSYVKAKLKDDAVPLEIRCKLCELIAYEHDWIHVFS